ncbi:hypothetical protein [Streptomyces sp. NPDC088725]|uniref:COG4315 family predicted lipoprotein n=1 Tax=Streptomyces sp. NPDC088725 TaxID=3365873 RepID=UPI00382935CB
MRITARTAVAVVTATLFAAAVGGCSNGGGGSAASQPNAPAEASATVIAKASSSPSGAPDTVISKSGSLGKILLDPKGRTLYVFDKDKTSKSTCDGGCATAWPPLVFTGKPKAGSGVKSSLLSTTTRSDGSKQVTYHGHPLYLYQGDQKPGDLNGQGLNQFGAKWYVIDTSGKQVTKTPSGGGGGGGGY